VPALSKALKDEDMFVRMHAAQSLGHIADRLSVPALLEALNDPDEHVRKCAAEALKKIDPEAAAKAGVK